MYFPSIEYSKASLNNCKIGTRCSVWKTVEYLKTFSAELKWFRAHDQFKHVFHMPEEPNHQLQGMLMLVLRTARTSSEEEAWFVVNGIPIRYSIREHAILTGFNCKEYPENWTDLGSLAFAEKVFGKTNLKKNGVKINDVRAKLEEMKKKNKSSTDRMKLAVLYFLCNVLKAKSKNDGKIDTFLLRIVDDLSACETFPWGRYTFADCIGGLKSMLKNMNGVTKKGAQPCYSGFIIPLEILPFECVRVLGRKFRADVSADPGCPRMCKRKFASGGTKGFTLDEINEALGNTKDIISIMEPTDQERGLLKRNVEDYVDDGLGYVDPVVDSWNERLLVKRKKVFWKSYYEKDVRARSSSSGLPSSSMMYIEDGNEQEKPVENLESLKAELLTALDKGFGKCLEAIGVVDTKVVKKLGDLDLRVKVMQNYVVTRGNGMRVEGGTPRSGFIMVDSPTFVTPLGDPLSTLDEDAGAEEVASQLMEMGKVKEREKAEKEKKEVADADLGNDETEMDEQQSVAAVEKEKELAEAELDKNKNMVDVKQELRDAVEKHVREMEEAAKVKEGKKKKKKARKSNKVEAMETTKEKEKDGEAEAVGKRKNEKESDGDGEDDKKKKRLKVEKMKKSLGDVELVATGTKRNRE